MAISTSTMVLSHFFYLANMRILSFLIVLLFIVAEDLEGQVIPEDRVLAINELERYLTPEKRNPTA